MSLSTTVAWDSYLPGVEWKDLNAIVPLDKVGPEMTCYVSSASDVKLLTHSAESDPWHTQ